MLTLSEYMDNGRRAIVGYIENIGYEVIFYEEGQVKTDHRRRFVGKTRVNRELAEMAAENWVLKV